MAPGHIDSYAEVVADALTLRDPTPKRLLNALTECAIDLVDLRDPHLVLQAIVRRTRALLGTDMAYLSLNDLARGETHIEVTDGVRTEAYRTIRMPLGTGVLGAVAAGGIDVQTRDYLRDDAMNHLPEIDEIVRGEGVYAIHGCPVRASGRVVAALLVAHRTPIRFTGRQISALRRMAEHAAIALEPTHGGADDTLLLFVDELIERIPEGAQTVCDLLAERLDQPVELHGVEPSVVGAEPDTLRTAISASLHTGAPVAFATRELTMAVLAIRHHHVHLGTVVVPVDPLALGERGLRLMSRASTAIGAAMAAQQQFGQAQRRSGSDLVAELLRAGRVDADLATRLGAHGIVRRRQVGVLVVAVPPGVSRSVVEIAARRAVSRGAVLTSTRGDEHCILAQVSDPSGFAARLLGHLDGDALVGFAVVTGLDRVPTAYELARRTVTALTALGVRRACADPGRLGPAAMLVSGADPALVDVIIATRIQPLLDYDADRDGRFTETAWVVLECGGRLQDAANRLHIHPNTVRQRSERITALLGPSWRVAPDSLDVHFALRLWRVRESLRA